MKLLTTMLAAAAIWPAAHARAQEYTCKGDCGSVVIEPVGNVQYVYFHVRVNESITHANFRLDSGHQVEVPVAFGETKQFHVEPGPWVSMQGCRHSVAVLGIGKSTCTRWSRFRFERVKVSAPPGPVISSIGKRKPKKPSGPVITSIGKRKIVPGTCKTGYVWRDAADGDGVCVTPMERTIAKAQNTKARARRQRGGGAYGPNTCKQGYVWREAFSGDVVCVTPKERADARRQNKEAARHTN